MPEQQLGQDKSSMPPLPLGASERFAGETGDAAVAGHRRKDSKTKWPGADFGTAWRHRRVARLAFLVGQGMSADEIARDPMVCATPNNVYRQAHRFGLAFRDAVTVRTAPDVEKELETAAAKRQLTRDALIKLLLTVAARDNLIDGIIDDGC